MDTFKYSLTYVRLTQVLNLQLEFEKLEAVRREYKQKVMQASRMSEFFDWFLNCLV
jgi:hypothetical protein